MFLLNFYSQLCSFSLCSLYFHNFLHHSQFLFMFPATSAISTLSEHFFFLLGLPYRFSYNCLKYVSRHWFTAHSLIYTHTTTYIHTQLHTYTHTATLIFTYWHLKSDKKHTPFVIEIGIPAAVLVNLSKLYSSVHCGKSYKNKKKSRNRLKTAFVCSSHWKRGEQDSHKLAHTNLRDFFGRVCAMHSLLT